MVANRRAPGRSVRAQGDALAREAVLPLAMLQGAGARAFLQAEGVRYWMLE
jgi:hypothetical protein